MAKEPLPLPTTLPNWNGWYLHAPSHRLIGPVSEYEVYLDDCKTSAQIADWIFQVSKKTWATDSILAGLVRALDAILAPKSHICSNGVDKPQSDLFIELAVHNFLVRIKAERRYGEEEAST
jgi:hypothetical protein